VGVGAGAGAGTPSGEATRGDGGTGAAAGVSAAFAALRFAESACAGADASFELEALALFDDEAFAECALLLAVTSAGLQTHKKITPGLVKR
jgi:hypothetical protein